MAEDTDRTDASKPGDKPAKPTYADLAEDHPANRDIPNLKRALEKQRRINRAAVTQRMDVDDLKSTVGDLAEMMRTAMESGSITGVVDAGPKLQEIKVRQEGRQATLQARKTVSEMLVDTDTDLSDPQNDEVRNLWDAGKYQEAAQLAESRVSGSESKEDFDNRVQAAVQEVVKGLGKVDAGSSVGGAGIPTDPAELNEKLKDPAWRKEHRKDILRLAAEGTITLR